MSDSHTDKNIGKHAFVAILLVVMVMAVADKFLFSVWPFWGLEYEDSYIYAATGRFMLYEYPWTVDLYKTKFASIGSLVHVQESLSYATHAEGFSLIIAAFHKILGYRPYTPLLVSSLAGVATLLILSIVAWWSKTDQKARLCLCLICFLAAPLARSFQSSGVSEVLSSLPVLLALIMMVRLASEDNDRMKYRRVSLFLLFFVAALLVKRENLALASAPILLLVTCRSALKQRWFWVFGLAVSGICISYLSSVDLMGGVNAESTGIHVSAFSLRHFADNAPRFIECWVRPDMWGITGIITLAAAATSWRSYRDPRVLFPVALLIIYIGLYTVHFRSQYQVADGRVTAFEMMRFSVNIFPIAVYLVIGSPVCGLAFSHKTSRYLLIMVAILGAIYSTNVKRHFSYLEYIERVEPLQYGLDNTGSDGVFVTDVTCLARILCSENHFIVDSMRLTNDVLYEALVDGKRHAVLMNRPDDFDEIARQFSDVGAVFRCRRKFHSYDINIYDFKNAEIKKSAF